MTPPNILLVVLDTLRRDRLSAYGHPRATSPELDDFAARATLFDRAVSPAQWTIPAHASLFTGVYPTTHQLTEANGRLSGAFPTLAEILRGGGYHTAGFCNNPLLGVLDNGLTRGFDHFYNYAGTVPNRPFDTAGPAPLRAVKTRFRRHVARPIENHFAQSDTLFRLSMSPLVVPFWSRLINFKGHTASTIDDLIAYWSRHEAGGAERPLFAFVNLMGAHLPYRPPQAAVDRIAPALRHDRRAYDFVRAFNTDAGRWAAPEPDLTGWQRSALMDFYDAEIAEQDRQVGRLLRYLRQSGALDNTLVIVLADHGEGHGDHNFFGHGFVVYQELVHVPLVIHYPDRFPAGRRVPTNVSTRRVFHTILDAAGVPPPLDAADPNADVRRLTLAQAPNGQPDSEGGMAYAEAFPPQTFLGFIRQRRPALLDRLRLSQVRRGVYAGSHKLALVGAQVEGLYDVAADPAETADLAAQDSARAATLQQQAAAFVADAEARRAGAGLTADADESVLDHLRALGYVE